MTNTQLRKLFSKTQRGFTLIELLIVIAVLGVLATVVLVAIDPLEQLARARDAGRKSTVSQVAKAVQAYQVSHDGKLFQWQADNDPTWQSYLVDAGDLKQSVSVPGVATGRDCRETTPYINLGNICYTRYATTPYEQAAVWVALESKSEKARADELNGGTVGDCAYPVFMWHSGQNKAGYACLLLFTDYQFTATTPTIY